MVKDEKLETVQCFDVENSAEEVLKPMLYRRTLESYRVGTSSTGLRESMLDVASSKRMCIITNMFHFSRVHQCILQGLGG